MKPSQNWPCHQISSAKKYHTGRSKRWLGGFLLAVFATYSHAGDRLLATGGVTQIEGASGGGLAPWAVIAGYGTQDQIGGSAFYTTARSRGKYELDSGGLAIGLWNRVELSLARTRFGLADTAPGKAIQMITAGAKLRLFGDAIYDQDSWMPQVSAGMLVKHNEDFDVIPKALGARNGTGVDFYLTASKLYLAGLWGRNVLFNAGLHATRANQFGLLGFGGDKTNGYRIKPTLSVAFLLLDNLALGTEYRSKPDNLSVFKEQAAHSAFIAWFPFKNLALTAAYVNLGNVANKPNQDTFYLSVAMPL